MKHIDTISVKVDGQEITLDSDDIQLVIMMIEESGFDISELNLNDFELKDFERLSFSQKIFLGIFIRIVITSLSEELEVAPKRALGTFFSKIMDDYVETQILPDLEKKYS